MSMTDDERKTLVRLELEKAKALCVTFQEEFIEKWHEHVDEKN